LSVFPSRALRDKLHGRVHLSLEQSRASYQ
jgi:hypothetical protein